MAHSKVIDRKALRKYKKLLQDSHDTQIHERFDQLEQLIKDQKSGSPQAKETETQPVDNKVIKRAPQRHEILYHALYHVAISHYEKTHNIYFEHQVEFVKGQDRLILDAVRQDDDLPEDIIIEVHYLRTYYMDAPAYASWLEKKIELYELLTGRPARGILMAVVGREKMTGDNYLDLTRKGVSDCKNISLEVYSCEDIGFYPGAVSAAMFASNLKEANNSIQPTAEAASD